MKLIQTVTFTVNACKQIDYIRYHPNSSSLNQTKPLKNAVLKAKNISEEE